MNKRIEKLAIEAFFDEETNQPGQKMYTFGEEKMQKFAELIVRECFHLFVSDHDEEHEEILESIKEHFGIEE